MLHRPEQAWNSDRIRRAAVCGLLLAAVGLVFGQTAGFGFVNYDDNVDVYENRAVTGDLGPRCLLDATTGSWTSLTRLSHIFVWHFLGHGAAAHHLVNVLLHATSVVLLLLVLSKMTGAFGPAPWWPRSLPPIPFA